MLKAITATLNLVNRLLAYFNPPKPAAKPALAHRSEPIKSAVPQPIAPLQPSGNVAVIAAWTEPAANEPEPVSLESLEMPNADLEPITPEFLALISEPATEAILQTEEAAAPPKLSRGELVQSLLDEAWQQGFTTYKNLAQYVELQSGTACSKKVISAWKKERGLVTA
jgi:hypothetical protein